MDFVDLVVKAQKGDLDAYGELVRRFQGMAFGYAYSLLDDFHLAQDAAQDALLQGFRDIAMLYEPNAWPTWLRRIVFKHCDRLRRRKRFTVVPMEAAEAVPDDSSLADERLVKEEMKQQLQVALSNLRDEERAITILFYFGGYSQRDITDFLEIPLDTVKNRLRSAKKKLYERMIAMTKEVFREEIPCYRRPLSCAASKGHLEVVKLLLERGADPNAREDICQGGLSLHTAAANNHLEVVRLLLESGANPEHWVDSSGTALIGARTDEMRQLLYSYGATTEIQWYAAHYRIDVVAEVLRLKPSLANEVLPYAWVDPKDDEKTAMDIMRLAIQYGARFENESAWKLRNTVLKYRNVARLLFEHGADPNVPLVSLAGDYPGRDENITPRRDAIAFLIEECGANVNHRDDSGMTPLVAAAAAGRKELVAYLLSKGTEVNPEIPTWCQPLYLAEKNGHTEVAEILKKHGAKK